MLTGRKAGGAWALVLVLLVAGAAGTGTGTGGPSRLYWAWLHGETDTQPQEFNPGTKNVPAASNNPGVNPHQGFWVYQETLDSPIVLHLLSMIPLVDCNWEECIYAMILWEFDLQTLMWTWIRGYDESATSVSNPNEFGVYAPENFPSSQDSTGNCYFTHENEHYLMIRSGLWKFSPSLKQWAWVHEYPPETSSTTSTDLTGHCWYDEDQKIFGMFRILWEYEFWVFNFSSLSWMSLDAPSTNEIPEYAAYFTHAKSMFAFGGRDYYNRAPLNPMWQYSFDDMENWVQVSPGSLNGIERKGAYGEFQSTFIPVSRSKMTSFKSLNNSILIVGGYHSTLPNSDVWEYDLEIDGNGTWGWFGGDVADSSSQSPSYRSFFGAIEIGIQAGLSASLYGNHFVVGAEHKDSDGGRLWMATECYPVDPEIHEYDSINTCRKLCLSGTFYDNASGNCKPCTAGTFNDIFPSPTRCFNCPVGKFSTEGSSSCEDCYSGTYTDEEGSETCKSCPLNSFSSPGSASVDDCICSLGFYGFSGVGCILCSEGLECSEVNLTSPRVKDGFRFLQDGLFDEETGFALLRCQPAEACINNQCSDLYRGSEQCDSCTPNLAFKVGTICQPCPKGNGSGSGYFILAAVAIMLFVYFTITKSFPKTTKSYSLSVSLSWIQIILLFDSIPSPWPESLRTMFSGLSFLNLNSDLVAPECSNSSFGYWRKWTLNMFAPLLIGAALMIWFGFQLFMERFFGDMNSVFCKSPKEIISFGLWKTKNSSKSNLSYKEDQFKRTRFIFAFASLTSFLYTGLASRSTQIFNCYKKLDGSEDLYLLYAPDVRCFVGIWWSYFTLSMFGLVTYVLGIPLFCLYVVYKNFANEDKSKELSRFGLWILPYRQSCYYWELVNFFKKAFLAIFIQFISFQDNFFFMLFIMTLLLSLNLLVMGLLRPYRSPVINILSCLWNFLAVIILYSGLLFQIGSLNADGLSSALIAIIALQCLLSLIVFKKERKAISAIASLEKSTKMNFFENWTELTTYTKKHFPGSHKQVLSKFEKMSVETQVKLLKVMKKL